MLRDLAYDETVEKVAEVMVPKMNELLEDIRSDLRNHDYQVEPIIDLTDSEYRFTFGAVRPDGLDFEIECLMIEERVNEGSDEYGCTFMLGIHKQGGLCVDDISPYNFTSHIWEPDLRDIQSVLARWELLTSIVMDLNIVLMLDEEKKVEGRQ
jgi:hypothetical protein